MSLLLNRQSALGGPSGTLENYLLHYLHQKVRAALKASNYGQAIYWLGYLIAQDPKNSTYYSNRGLLYSRCKQWSRALEDYNQAIRLTPGQGPIYSSRAKCNAWMGDWQAAIADYDSAIEINPHDLRSRLEQGILLRHLKLYDDAITCFDLALFLGDLPAYIYAERGRTHHLNGHWNCASGDYVEALSLIERTPNRVLALKIQTWLAELLAS